MTPQELLYVDVARQLRALEQRVEDLEIAREQERAQTNDVVDGLLRESSPEGMTSVAQLRAELAAARRALRMDHASLVEAHGKSCDERARLVEQTEVLRCVEADAVRWEHIADDARAELERLRMDHEALIEAHAKSCDERARLVAELGRAHENEPKIVRVMMSALDRVHDALGTDGERGEGDVADRVAAVVQELSRLRAGLRTMVERAAAEIPNRRARDAFLSDWSKELGDG